jgi:hypothetical protein
VLLPAVLRLLDERALRAAGEPRVVKLDRKAAKQAA